VADFKDISSKRDPVGLPMVKAERRFKKDYDKF